MGVFSSSYLHNLSPLRTSPLIIPAITLDRCPCFISTTTPPPSLTVSLKTLSQLAPALVPALPPQSPSTRRRGTMISTVQGNCNFPVWSHLLLNFLSRLDLFESKDTNTVTAMFELPGLTSEGVAIDVHQNRLTVSGESTTSDSEEGRDYVVRERRSGKFSRTLQLPIGTKVGSWFGFSFESGF